MAIGRVTSGEFIATTRSVVVSVKPVFLDDQSDPEDNRFVWAYRVNIYNAGQDTIQLLRRSWQITDGCGWTIDVKGSGVVGEQPVLEPGDSFEYTSGTPLETPLGFMQGTYHMVSTVTGELFDIAIPAFSLDSPHGKVH